MLSFVLTTSALLRAEAATAVIAWGGGSSNTIAHPQYAQSVVPDNLTNAQQVAAGLYQSFALRDDGTVVGWGWNAYNQTSIPPGLSNVIALAPGWYHTLALKADGTVAAWGWGYFGETTPPSDLTNAVAIAAGDSFGLALRSDGTVVRWGLSFIEPPAGLSNVVAIAAGKGHALALKKDGTVVIWGDWGGFYSPPGYNVFDMPAGLKDIVAVAAGGYQSMLLKADGTVVTWGNWSGPNVPADLTNVAAIATGGHNLALTREGKIVSWGFDEYGDTVVPAGVSNGIAIAAGEVHSLAVLGNGAPVMARQPVDREVYSGTDISFSAGAVGAPPLSYQWYLDGTVMPGATNALLALTNVQVPDAGSYRVVVSNGQGTVTSASARLSVLLSLPLLQLQPVAQVVAISSNLTLSASAVGSLPMRYQWQFNESNIAGATNSALALTNLTLAFEGDYRCLITNDYGLATSSNAFVNVVDLPEALNATSMVWNSTGNLPWVPEFSLTHDGTAAAQAGDIGYDQQSVLETTLTGPGTLSFWWKVSSETNDFLTVSVNGTPQAAIAGVRGWQQSTAYLGSGPQTVRWTFARGNSGSAAGYAAWLDQVSFAPGTTPAGLLVEPSSRVSWLRNPVAFTATASGTPPLRWQWQFNGSDIPGATDASFSIPSATFADVGNYRVLVTNDYGNDVSSNAVLRVDTIVPWGDNTYGQTNIPADLTNVIAIATGGYHNLAVRNDGTVVGWGRNDYGQAHVPPGLSNVVAVAAGLLHSVALTTNGAVIAWGSNTSGQTNVPAGLSNAVAVACGANLSAAVDARGVIWMWGYNNIGPVPLAASNAVAVAPAKGGYNAAALRSDGRMVLWPRPAQDPNARFVIPPVSNIVSVVAGGTYVLGLREDRTAFSGGFQSDMTNIPGPADVVSLAAGSVHSLLLRSNGTVTAFGDNGSGQIRVPPQLTNVVAIAAGERVSLALVNDGFPFIIRQPMNRWIPSGGRTGFEVVAASSEPIQYQWQFNGNILQDETNSILVLENVPVTRAGMYLCVLSNRLGTVVSFPASLNVSRTALRFEAGPDYPRLTSSGLRLKVNGLSGAGEWLIYGSSNLLNWQPLWTNPPAVGSQEWLDPSATNLLLRFYRAEEK